MITSQELRIGNWVRHQPVWSYRQDEEDMKEFDFQWADSDWYALGESTLNIDDVSPIPLTSEWLEKFGFEFLIDFSEDKDGHCYCELNGFKLWESNPDKFYHLNSELLINFDYVHELQNFFSAAIKKELTTKEKV